MCVHIPAGRGNPGQGKLVGACSVQGDFSSAVPTMIRSTSIFSLKYEGETDPKQLLPPYNLVKSIANSS